MSFDRAPFRGSSVCFPSTMTGRTKANDMCGLMGRKMTLDKCQPKDSMVQALDAELQKMIDEELVSVEKEVSSANLASNSTDPDAAVSKHMEASLRLWNKLTEIRNNYKVELKKKQDERIDFEKDVGVEASKTSSELAALELEIQRTNKDICAMESQMAEAQAYHQQIQVETKDMEQQVKELVAEDAALSIEAQEVQKTLKNLEYSIAQVEGEYLRHKSQAEKELALSECTYGKELEQKDQQISQYREELEEVERQLTSYDRCNPHETTLMQYRQEMQHLKAENDMLEAEIKQISHGNQQLQERAKCALDSAEEKLRRQEASNRLEDEAMSRELRTLDKQLRGVEDHVRQLEDQASQLDKETREREKDIESRQREIEHAKSQLKEKEQTMKEFSLLIEQQQRLEQEMEESFAQDLAQLQNQTDGKVRDLKTQIVASWQKRQENVTRLRALCQEIKGAKGRLKEAEMAAQGTFKKLKSLTEEYEALKKQNCRHEEFISFYEAIRTYEAKYVEVKHALSRAKDQAQYYDSSADIPPSRHPFSTRHQPPSHGKSRREKRAHSGTSSNDSLVDLGGNSGHKTAAFPHSQKVYQGQGGCRISENRSRADVSRRTVDPLTSDPLLQQCLNMSKAKSQSFHCNY